MSARTNWKNWKEYRIPSSFLTYQWGKNPKASSNIAPGEKTKKNTPNGVEVVHNKYPGTRLKIIRRGRVLLSLGSEKSSKASFRKTDKQKNFKENLISNKVPNPVPRTN